MEEKKSYHNGLVIYNASAGSGKTFTLAAEYISILLRTIGNATSSRAHRCVLAVTFTNKATAEMKDRIISYLLMLSSSPEEVKQDDNFIAKVTELTEISDLKELRRRSQVALTGILHDYDHFHVSTIDSFLQRILKGIARELNLAADFKVELNDQDVLSRAVDELMSELGEETKEADKVKKLVMQFISNKIDDSKDWNVSGLLKHFGHHLFDKEYIEATQGSSDKSSELNEYLEHIGKALSEANAKTAKQMDELGRQLLEAIEGKDLDNLPRKTNAIEKMIEDKEKLPSETFLKLATPEGKWLKKKSKTTQEEANKFRDDIAEIIKLWKVYTTLKMVDETNSPLRLLEELKRRVDEISKETHHFLLARTPYLLQQMIEDSDTPFVLEKAALSFNHVLIDEFQDTSTVQWKLFRLLIKEFVAEGCRCLVVGDVKQSIYRWRNGDWQILQSLSNDRTLSPVTEPLETNFRSEENLIEFCNSLFKVMEAYVVEAGPLYASVEEKFPTSKTKGKGYVNVKFYQKQKDEEETVEEQIMSDLVEDIRAMHGGGLPFNEMMILVRSNKSTADIVNYFKEQDINDIPLSSSEAFILSSSPSVKTIIAALRILNEKPKDVEKDSYQADLVARAELHKFLLGEDFSAERLDKYERNTPAQMERLINERKKYLEMPLYELVEALIELFDLANNPSDEDYIYTFLDEIKNYLSESSTVVDEFLEFWDEQLYKKSIFADKADGVSIQTIHKSKGLEAHTVFIPFADWDLEENLNKTEVWCDKPGEGDATLLPPLTLLTCLPKMNFSAYVPDMEKERKAKRVDSVNLLYVALTRAAKNLFVYSDSSTNKDGGIKTVGALMAQHFGAEGTEIGKPIFSFKTATQSNQINCLANTERIKMAFKISDEAREFAENLARSERELGTLYHELLSRINEKSQTDATLNQYLLLNPNDKETIERLRQTLLKAFVDESLPVGKWFDGSGQILNERSILFADASHNRSVSRPDRVICYPDHTVIVDYKFGEEQKKYTKQVSQYVALLAEMGYPQCEGYLWYVMEGRVSSPIV